jgi:hypothetical protein
MNNRERLINLITDFKLDRLTVAEMLKVKRNTVDNWLMSSESRSQEEMPDMAIELLEYKLGLKKEESEESSPGI